MTKKIMLTTLCLTVVLTGASAFSQDTSEEQANPVDKSIWLYQTQNSPNDTALKNFYEYSKLQNQNQDDPAAFWLQTAAAKPSPFLIGVHCEAAGETKFMSKEVGGLITVKGGLKINKVSDDSPAEKVGMEVGDIILFVEDKMVSDINDLGAIVTEKGESEIHGALVRDEQIVEFDVTPVKRPEEKKTEQPANEFALDKTLYWYLPNKSTLPEGYSVTIQLENGSKPSLTVKKGDETWKTSNGRVAKLPDDTKPFARAAVQSLLPLVGSKNKNLNYAWGNYRKLLPQANRWTPTVIARQPVADKNIANKLDALQKQIEELSKVVGELKKEND